QDEARIRSFHFEYQSAANQGHCTGTDDATTDSFWRGASNRSQFSYNQDVVRDGLYSPWTVYWGRPTSSFQGAADNRTQMIKYATVKQVACVPFYIHVSADDYSFRINDLEGRQLPSKNRTPETRWPPR